MHWSIEQHTSEEILIVSFQGAWELPEGIEALRALWQKRSETGYRRVLWDLRELEANGVTSTEVRDLAHRHIHERPDLSEAKAAMVVTGNMEFGMGRMMEAFLSDGPVELQVFRDLDLATAWLEGEEVPVVSSPPAL